MVRFSRWIGVGTIMVAVLGLLVLGAHWLEAAARQPAGVWGDPHVGMVVDTTDSMATELGELAQVWDDSDIVHLENATYSRLWYTDTVGALPSTGDPAAVQAWLNSLQAAGGGACPDAALQALLAAATLVGSTETSGDAQMLLLSDSSPQGGRTALARVANRLLQSGVRVYPVQSGWCWGQTPLPMEAIRVLGQMTGGTAWPVAHGTGLTHTQMALNLMAAGDDLLSVGGTVATDETDVHQFEVDSSVDRITLQVNNAADSWTCLTCTMPITLQRTRTYTIRPPLTATLRLPGGQTIGPGDPGVTFLGSGYGIQLGLSSQGDTQLPSGIWQLRIEGNTAYDLRVAANAGIHMAYIGPHSVPAGRPLDVRVALLLPAVQGLQSASAAWELEGGTLESSFIPLRGGQSLQGGTLYDDGEHNDGAAGDGLFGGEATLSPGAYRLAIRGELTDGTTVQRVDPSPIRVRRFQLRSPGARQATPGTSVTQTFVLVNDQDTEQGYELLAESSQGWAQTNGVPVSVTLSAGETMTLSVPVLIPKGTSLGTVEESSLTVVGADLLTSEMVTAAITVVDSFDVYLPFVRRE